MIGVLTLHNATNYGAILQTYALQHVLDDMGIENEVVSYECPKITKQHQIRMKWWNPLGYEIKKRTKNRFHFFFLNNIRHSEVVRELLPSAHYDTYLVGSDQVWNMNLTGNDMTYFLENLPSGVPKYSYAASMGNYRFTDKTLQERCFACLDTFTGISVREQSLAGYLSDGMVHRQQRKIEVHPDPVLLLDRNEWEKLAKHTQKGKYILLYMIGRNYELIQKAQILSKEMGIPVLWASDSLRHYRYVKNVRCSSPEEFVGLFEDSFYVVTNSFHGTAFSILFQKPFLTTAVHEGKRMERIADLMDALGLTTYCGNDCTAQAALSPDWNKVEEKLLMMKVNAINYLGNLKKGDGIC
ncbi:MAG: polysaccharide pyruvyl transferase family protein [Lachnospiraceae bacterium]|nr:polysaccharide pyruvyl transferase family protein [Lachnospiraceae bacterium]